MDIKNSGFASIQQITSQYLNNSNVNQAKQLSGDISFEEALKQAKESGEGLVFSKHAINRLNDRNITISNEQLARLNEGSKKASEKGITESLVLLDNLAFIVNTKNNTVITAMNSDTEGENIYTNIDGAVVI